MKIKYVADVNRRVLPESTDPNREFAYIDISAVSANGLMTIPEETIRFEAAPSRARRLAPVGSTVVSTVRTYLRAVALVRATSAPLVFSTGFAVLEPKSELDSRFLAYCCLSDPFIDNVVARSTGVSYPAINPSELVNIDIPTPTLEEQRRIADFLDAETARIDRLMSLRSRSALELGERYRAIRDSAIDEAFGTSGQVPLRRLVTRVTQGSSPQCDNVARSGNDWAVLKLSAVKRGVFQPAENKRLPDDVEPIRQHAVQPGDLLVTRANTPDLVGDAAIVTGVSAHLLLPDLIYRINLERGVDPSFVLHCVLGTRIRQLIQAVARGSSQSMVKLRGEDILSWPVPALDMAQQRTFASRVSGDLDQTTRVPALIREQLNLLAERRQALITAAVTGQFDVATGRGADLS